MTNIARLNAISFRMDGTRMTSAAPRMLKGLKLSLGYTSKTPSTMSATFAANRTSRQTLVFDGDLALPAQIATRRSFNVRIAFNKTSFFAYDKKLGNLLIEMEVAGSARTDFGYMIDAHVQSTSRGFYTDYGTGGRLSNGETARVLVQDDFNLRPGRSFTMSVSALRAGYPTVVLLGFSNTQTGTVALPVPLDGIGMTGNVLEISPDLAFPISLLKSGNTYVGSLRLAVPASGRDLRVFSQFLFLDTKANRFGAALSPGLAVWIQSSVQEHQYVTNRDSTATSGRIGHRGEGLVVRFEGIIR